jgi:hypothetical protein
MDPAGEAPAPELPGPKARRGDVRIVGEHTGFSGDRDLGGKGSFGPGGEPGREGDFGKREGQPRFAGEFRGRGIVLDAPREADGGSAGRDLEPLDHDLFSTETAPEGEAPEAEVPI